MKWSRETARLNAEISPGNRERRWLGSKSVSMPGALGVAISWESTLVFRKLHQHQPRILGFLSFVYIYMDLTWQWTIFHLVIKKFGLPIAILNYQMVIG